ncbi:hypothetical protein JOF56_007415 [Kibdelosporangium banguiense]|uniref:Uncharacterized protein n=1 Tax=Kibdelosporangium banguiense TaxID=1365924 RepID=A0ABS4TRI8_9PSEU|nr:hypothetical protein [Kibdelosporangium banguiense]MBP2327030.1 hypothetical protein [Kibdelosporangium banguiense]
MTTTDAVPVLVRIASGPEDSRQATADLVMALTEDLTQAGIRTRASSAVPPPLGKSPPSALFETLLVYGIASPAAAAAFTKVVIAFLHRQRDRKIVIEHDDDRIEVHGASAADQRAAIEAWCTRQADRHTTTDAD